MTTTKAPPTVRAGVMRTVPGYVLGLRIACGWCDRELWRVQDACLGCRAALHRLDRIHGTEAWRTWLDVLRREPEAAPIVADWLEEQGWLDAADDLRTLVPADCRKCEGKGVIRDRWLTVWPHEGKACPHCNGFKRVLLKEMPT